MIISVSFVILKKGYSAYMNETMIQDSYQGTIKATNKCAVLVGNFDRLLEVFRFDRRLAIASSSGVLSIIF